VCLSNLTYVKYRFDLADQDFTTEVLALAPRCEALYFSIMALSSFHHFQNTGEREGEDEEYHQNAITMLVTMMQDPLLLEDGAGLASAVILRLYEESKGDFLLSAISPHG
jgi:hypothetical protein